MLLKSPLKSPFIPVVPFEIHYGTNSPLLNFATLVGLLKGEISTPPHPPLLPGGEKR